MKRRQPRSEEPDWTRGWQLGWWRKDFRPLKKDPSFQALVTIARLGNAIRFAQAVVAELPAANTPGLRRQMINAFYLSNALLVEAERTIQNATKHFRGNPEFIALARVTHLASFREVTERCRKLRKWSAFHFDPQAAADGLARRNEDFVRFVSGVGHRDRDTYFDLGDIVALETMVSPMESPEQFEQWFKDWLTKSADATNHLITALTIFVAGAARAFGAVERPLGASG